MILDDRTATTDGPTSEFIRAVRHRGHLVSVGDEIRSYVVLDDEVFTSPIAGTTLAERAAEGGWS